ncbi:class I adenylate-forming enzyme family protein [Puia dinghuensis]|uniref:Putative O-succinylbenzoic acid--CoA ligase MenE n=1 Tax=Puia dinghuensis TaxID=1792502 RepID=A0A8J2UGI6_9BACT|nr:fatty acid--CoA ligase family protein [Puia dinghuensis]GGB14570.1 putative O-succinylbenzoic acid--CoA ligase MenE [Puia dinghuensis]
MSQMIPPHTGNNPIADQTSCLTYDELKGIMQRLDVFFAGQGQIACLAMATENTVSGVLMILYLLSRRINVFLLPPQAPVDKSIPAFCDRILSVDGEHPDRPILRDHAEFAGNGDTPVSGAVFFASSGTTGTPKYVRFDGENLLRNARNCMERFGYSAASKVLIPVPIGHMYGLGVGLLPALMAGASIRLIDRNNAIKLKEQLASFQPDITLVTPTVIRMLLLLPKGQGRHGMFITAGEKIATKDFQDFESAYGPLFNLYGCTELGAIATSPTEGKKSDGLLKPLDGVEVKIDADGQVRCRHNAPFASYVDPHGRLLAAATEEWYPTKDIGMAEEAGNFRVLGRMDHCVNRSGYLVSLDEVGSCLENLFQGIRQAIVLDAGVTKGLTTKLIAVCEVTEEGAFDADTVRKICKDKLNKQMIPDEFHFIREMPRLNNGKADRALLSRRYTENH